jgi:hypothetical protein
MDSGAQQVIEQAQTLARLWMETVSRMTGAAFAFTPGSAPPEAARQMREAFFSAVGSSLESYMRSEPFLRTMKQSLDLGLEMRKQFTQLATQVHHSAGAPAHDDVRSVLQGIRHVEERLSRRMDEMLSRLDELDERLEGLRPPADNGREENGAGVTAGPGKPDHESLAGRARAGDAGGRSGGHAKAGRSRKGRRESR